MKKYLLREKTKVGIEKSEDVFAGCTKDSDYSSMTKCVFENEEDALKELKNNEFFKNSIVIRNWLTNGYEVTEFFVTLAEVGELDNATEEGTIIAYSNMPDKSSASWHDNPNGF